MSRDDSNFDSTLKRWLDMLKFQLKQHQQMLNHSSLNTPNLNDYLDILFDFQNQTLDLLYLKINERIIAGKSLNSFREFFELWLECCETVYKKLILTDKYQNSYSQYINAVFASMQNTNRADVNE